MVLLVCNAMVYMAIWRTSTLNMVTSHVAIVRSAKEYRNREVLLCQPFATLNSKKIYK